MSILHKQHVVIVTMIISLLIQHSKRH